MTPVEICIGSVVMTLVILGAVGYALYRFLKEGEIDV